MIEFDVFEVDLLGSANFGDWIWCFNGDL